MKKYLIEGGIPVFWPEAADPDLFRPEPAEKDIDVLFIGKRFGYRGDYVEYLRSRGINVHAFGDGWESGKVSDSEMISLYNRSRIVLGFSGIGPSRRIRSLKGRDFEVPMAGALYLREYSPDIAEVFAIGREIVCFDGMKDCLSAIRRILADPGQAECIRSAARARSLRDHTWEKRYTTLFRDILGIME